MEGRVIGVVCARAGSKRLPNKNMLKINGKTLVERALNTLHRGGCNYRILYTDIQKYIDI